MVRSKHVAPVPPLSTPFSRPPLGGPHHYARSRFNCVLVFIPVLHNLRKLVYRDLPDMYSKNHHPIPYYFTSNNLFSFSKNSNVNMNNKKRVTVPFL